MNLAGKIRNVLQKAGPLCLWFEQTPGLCMMTLVFISPKFQCILECDKQYLASSWLYDFSNSASGSSSCSSSSSDSSACHVCTVLFFCQNIHEYTCILKEDYICACFWKDRTHACAHAHTRAELRSNSKWQLEAMSGYGQFQLEQARWCSKSWETKNHPAFIMGDLHTYPVLIKNITLLSHYFFHLDWYSYRPVFPKLK